MLLTCKWNRNPHNVLVRKGNFEYLVTDGRTTLQCVLMKRVGRPRGECICLSTGHVADICELTGSIKCREILD
jgi:hypothetical protein